MKRISGQLLFSPSDLTVYSDSPYASWMDNLALTHPEQAPKPNDHDPLMTLLQRRGYEYEKSVLTQFKTEGRSVVDCSDAKDPHQATQDTMRSGAEVIFQAALSAPPFAGFADFLVKVSGASELGDYHYEVWDTKLSRSIKPYFLVQLCCYQDMLSQLQGRRSQASVILLGHGQESRFNTDDYFFYYLALKTAFLDMHANFDAKTPLDPALFAHHGRWSDSVQQQLEARDHLSLVATISRSQIKKLEQAEIHSLTALANTTASHIPNLNADIFKRLKAQARIQHASRHAATSVPAFEILIPEPNVPIGLALLPPHSDQDVFFDIEGFPLEEGGLEYLWGNTYFDAQGQRAFIDFWAHNAEQEKQAFQDFIQWVYARWQADPSMHIYHYANYEIAACRKLMGRYGVCEHEVDQLLRNDVFVDLYKVVKSGLILGEPKYSIKNVEHLYRSKRDTEVGTGGDSVVVYENWRENPDGETWQTSKILNDIRLYNIDDCNSTQELVAWLREQQGQHNIAYVGDAEVVEPEQKEEITARIQLRDQLLSGSETFNPTHSEKATVLENLAWLLEFHRRETKPIFWRLFDRQGMTEVELMDDANCLALCKRTDRPPFKPENSTKRTKSLLYEYRYDPSQEFKLGSAKSFYVLGVKTEHDKDFKVTLVREASALDSGLIAVKASSEPPACITLIPDEYVNPNVIADAVERVVRSLHQDLDQACAITDVLFRRPPRIQKHEQDQTILTTESNQTPLEQIIDVVQRLDRSYLVIQGPPGAGKSYTAKHVIAELLKQGKCIGICSNSHHAINNLLINTAEFCKAQGIQAQIICKEDNNPRIAELGIAVIKDSKKLCEQIQPSCLIGTTAWGFAREDLHNAFDTLYIDEAGQVSLANLVALSQAAHNLVMMGDQMQLSQPAQGTHPADSGLSVLEYLLKDQATIDPAMGIFLATTYRMHSAVNQFISDAIYEGKLKSAPETDHQKVVVPQGYDGVLIKETGIQFIPVEHEGNAQASLEEVEVIQRLAKDYLGRTFIDKHHQQRLITWSDMLFVAPYNHQVTLLQTALGSEARVGSVDKFQGQEAPIVFLSLCASDAAQSPRGVDFLFDPNRINVAISRAQALAIVVGNPGLARVTVNHIEQMKKTNLVAKLLMY